MPQLIDQARIKIRSGDGGNGIVAWRREKYEPLGGPAGGNGGRGGHVYLEADANLATLIDFKYKSNYAAQHGARGGPKGMHGKSGADLVLKVPPGTVVRDLDSDEVIADLTEPGQRVLVAEGGRGGTGNAALATPTRRAPAYCEPGQPGISRELELELKLLADAGIVGLPNAGKSTLLSVLTAARPKIADYPFSTLEPNLGVLKKPDGDGYVLADIPGLIEGAAEGTGLGHKFLRHIERTRLIVHIADASSKTLDTDIETINRELSLYSERLSRLPQLVVLNKIDLVEPEDLRRIEDDLVEALPELLPPGSPAVLGDVLSISCATRKGLDLLRNALLEKLSRLEAPQPVAVVEEDVRAFEHPRQGFTVHRRKNVFTVSGDRIDRLVSVTNQRNPESLHHLYDRLRALGVIEALREAGAGPGSEVVMGGSTFEFGEDVY